MGDETKEKDEALCARIAAGDHRAFTKLVDRHTDRFYALAWKMCGDDRQAEDIVQEAFVKLWQNPEKYDPSRGAKFTTWFYRVVVNLSYDIARKKTPVDASHVIDIFESGERPVDEKIAEAEQQSELENAIQQLPERQKTALNLCFYEEVSNAEAAEIMGVGLKALESLLMRAKKNLRDYLIRDGQLKEASNGS